MERILIKDLNNKVGENVRLSGWVDVRREHGKLTFIDLRDVSGIVQMVALPNHKEASDTAQIIRPEWVIEVEGIVNKRPEKMVNKNIPTGNIEIEITGISVLSKSETPPFDVSGDGREIGEEHRLKWRYLDLRRPRMKKNIINRHKVLSFIRNYLSDKGFIEVETPILTKSTPEGARDFVVPSRIDRGKFYALPQSPQQYKQLLMVAGFEKYFQIARCLRDEDTRGDRQAEFTQLDLEMSFVKKEDLMSLVEEMYTKLVEIFYKDATITEKPWPRLSHKEAMNKYGSDKPDLRKNKTDEKELAFAWIVDFPLFEKEQENGHYAPAHHMFTAPREEDLAKLKDNPSNVLSHQFDLSLNGFEVAGGSVRIHDPELQTQIFNLIGFSEKEKSYFKHMLEAFRYGVPPHGGIASGIDRLLMVLEGEKSIREVIAFPKTGEGRDLLMGAPTEIGKEQLKELGIKIIE